MSSFEQFLSRRLEEIQTVGLSRRLRQIDTPQCPNIEVGGRSLLNFSSNDYLGLANHPELKAAATCAIERFGAGAGASRLICGSLAPHHWLEEALAAFKRTEAALTFSSGYATALGTVPALMGKGDVVIIDRLVHASLVDAARLSGAVLRVFAHNDLNDLERILRWAAEPPRNANRGDRLPQVLVVTESVFSMDGDQAPLAAMVALKDKYGAWLMVDDAHGTGLFGPNGSGLVAALGLTGRVEVQMGTLGKALGAAGGFIAGSRALIDYLINRARSFIFSTAPTPAAAAAAAAGVRLVQGASGQERREKLWRLVAQTRAGLGHDANEMASAIIPIVVGKETAAVRSSEELLAAGIFVPAIRYPTVARNKARLRITLTAAHQPDEVERLLTALSTQPILQQTHANSEPSL